MVIVGFHIRVLFSLFYRIFKDWLKFFLIYRILKDELWRPDFCDFTWEEAVQVDVVLQVLNKFDWIFWLVRELIQENFRKDFVSSSSDNMRRPPETSDVTQTISWWGKIELGRIRPPADDWNRLVFHPTPNAMACSNLVDIHDTLDPHTNSHLKEIVIWIHSNSSLYFNPLR